MSFVECRASSLWGMSSSALPVDRALPLVAQGTAMSSEKCQVRTGELVGDVAGNSTSPGEVEFQPKITEHDMT